jgi:hypothetical protein
MNIVISKPKKNYSLFPTLVNYFAGASINPRAAQSLGESALAAAAGIRP